MIGTKRGKKERHPCTAVNKRKKGKKKNVSPENLLLSSAIVNKCIDFEWEVGEREREEKK